MILKFIGGILLVLCGGSIGVKKLNYVKKSLAALEGMDNSLTLMEGEIYLCERPLPEIFEMLQQRSCEPCSAAFEKMNEVCFNCGAETAWINGIKSLALPEDAEKALMALGTVLGSTDGKRQSAEIQNTRNSIAASKERLKREIEEKGRSYPLLGLCFAALAAIILV